MTYIFESANENSQVYSFGKTVAEQENFDFRVNAIGQDVTKERKVSFVTAKDDLYVLRLDPSGGEKVFTEIQTSYTA